MQKLLDGCFERAGIKKKHVYLVQHSQVIISSKELVDSEINKTVPFMMEMAKNPEMMKRFEEFKENYK